MNAETQVNPKDQDEQLLLNPIQPGHFRGSSWQEQQKVS
jgi:hypothetical protein